MQGWRVPQRIKKLYSSSLSCFLFSFLLCCPLNFVLIFSCSRHFAICSMVWGREEMTTNVHSLRDPRGQIVFLLTVPYIKSTEETLQCPFGTPEPIIPKGWWWGIMVSQCWILCSLVWSERGTGGREQDIVIWGPLHTEYSKEGAVARRRGARVGQNRSSWAGKKQRNKMRCPL